ncbi:hypothetical protein AB0J83_43150 [Actinoplanes sp. NPDC049596]|uniref:hypothetical protein n=1 Tax=unclassified Actinoplanes TaxID=2626549 RepID=UPI00342A76A9
MSMRIGPSPWATHATLVHLRKDCLQLTTDVVAGADKKVIAADRAAVMDSRRTLQSHLDVTV